MMCKVIEICVLIVQERKFRKRVDADGEVGGLRDNRLSEFLEVSLRSQQAVRRAIRGAV